MKQVEMKKLLKMWIIDALDRTKNKRDLDYNLGVVSGLERVYMFVINKPADLERDVKAAYDRLDKRLYPKA